MDLTRLDLGGVQAPLPPNNVAAPSNWDRNQFFSALLFRTSRCHFEDGTQLTRYFICM